MKSEAATACYWSELLHCSHRSVCKHKNMVQHFKFLWVWQTFIRGGDTNPIGRDYSVGFVTSSPNSKPSVQSTHLLKMEKVKEGEDKLFRTKRGCEYNISPLIPLQVANCLWADAVSKSICDFFFIILVLFQ